MNAFEERFVKLYVVTLTWGFFVPPVSLANDTSVVQTSFFLAYLIHMEHIVKGNLDINLYFPFLHYVFVRFYYSLLCFSVATLNVQIKNVF